MIPQLTQENMEALALVGPKAGIDMSSFLTACMLEFLIGDEREAEFNEYLNHRVETLIGEARSMIARAELLRGQ